MQPTAQTAILLFLRPAAEEARHKRWQGNRRQDEAIAKHLIAHTQEAAAATGLPVIVCPSAQQQGSTFGQRFANAIESVFAQGYKHIVTLGTDTPDITPAAILEAARNVETGVLVTGPAPDGGVYTLGLSRANWNREAFLNIAWQTSAVQRGLARYATAGKLTQVALEALSDLDNKGDLHRWLQVSAGRPLHLLLRSILVSKVRVPACPVLLHLVAFSPCKGYCGPPAFIAA